MVDKDHYVFRTEAGYDLPASLSRSIGRVIVRWAYIEHKAQQLVRALAQITHPIGRIVAREPRLEDRITIIEQLAEFRGIELNQDGIASLREGTKLIAAKRHILAHGIWHKERGAWCLEISRGQWEDEDSPTRHKSILPESIPVTENDLAIILDGIGILDELLDIIGLQIFAKIQAPPELHPSQYPHKNPKRDQTALRRASQPQPSQAWAQKAKKLSAAQRRKMALGRAKRKNSDS
jgi:hypothetical protein